MKIKEYRWFQIPRKHPHKVPWGYEPNKDDNSLLDPIPEHLDALEAAKDFLLSPEYGASSREVARWLSDYTGVSITHTGLLKRIEYDNERFKEIYRTDEEEENSEPESPITET